MSDQPRGAYVRTYIPFRPGEDLASALAKHARATRTKNRSELIRSLCWQALAVHGVFPKGGKA